MAKQSTKVAVKKGKEPAAAAPAPMHTLAELRSEIDNEFERAFRNWPSFGHMFSDWSPFRDIGPVLGRVWGGKQPSTDVKETEKEYAITVELPGVDESDVDVTLSDGHLMVKGEKKSERSEDDKGFHLTERSYGRFERSFLLPEDVNADKAAATFDKGVLSITLPKDVKAKEKVRKVAVKAKK